MAKLPNADLVRRREERDGLDVSFRISSPMSFSISADGAGLMAKDNGLQLRKYARLTGKFDEGNRPIASEARVRIIEALDIATIKQRDGRYPLGDYRIRHGFMEANIYARAGDLVMLAGGSTWTAVRLKLSRPVHGDGTVWAWSIDAGEIWLNEEDLVEPTTPKIEKPVFTPKDLAARWDISVAAVHTAIKRGDLRAFQLGARLYRVRREAAEEYERARRESGDGSKDGAEWLP